MDRIRIGIVKSTRASEIASCNTCSKKARINAVRVAVVLLRIGQLHCLSPAMPSLSLPFDPHQPNP